MRYDEHTVVAHIGQLTVRDLRIWVREGWLAPVQAESGPVFDDLDMARIRLLCDLRKELSLSADAVEVIISLIDQLHGVRRDLRCLATAVASQPEEVRDAVARACLALKENSDEPAGGI